MKHRLRVKWPNPGHPLLSKPDIKVSAGSTSVTTTTVGPGEVHFTIENPSGAVDLTARFEQAVMGTTQTVLSANQRYQLSSGALRPTSATIGGLSPSTVANHPLVMTVVNKAASKATERVYDVTIVTDFVDVTIPWGMNTGSNKVKSWKELPVTGWEVYNHLAEQGSALVVLACTSGSPLLWFAVVPYVCRDAEQIGSLVFFRPASYTYSGIDDAAHADQGIYALCRYLLRPRTPPVNVTISGVGPFDVWWAADRYVSITPAQLATMPAGSPGLWDRLCAGFEFAIERSARKIVLFQPWPNGGSFGDATGTRLPFLLERARALLWSLGYIARGKTLSTEAHRIGLAGYSYGADALWRSFKSNRARVKEVYGFDPNFPSLPRPKESPKEFKARFSQHDPARVAAVTGDLGQWARLTPEFRLRLSGGYNVSIHSAMVSSVLAAAAGTAGQASSFPAAPSFYQPGTPWWDHVWSVFPALKTDPGWAKYRSDTPHQFAIYGGDRFAPPKPAGQPSESTTFLESFLNGSMFLL